MSIEYQLHHPNLLSNQLRKLINLIDMWQKLTNQQSNRIKELEEQNAELLSLLKRAMKLLDFNL